MDETLQRARETEQARAFEVWRRRFQAPPADAHERARQSRFLLARGFEAAVVQRVLKQAADEAEPQGKP